MVLGNTTVADSLKPIPFVSLMPLSEMSTVFILKKTGISYKIFNIIPFGISYKIMRYLIILVLRASWGPEHEDQEALRTHDLKS